MAHRNRLIALVVLEALLWLFVFWPHIIPLRPDLSMYRVTLNGATVTLFQVVNLAVLALTLVVGMMSRSWQGAIALNLLASAPAAILLALSIPFNVGMDSALLGLMAPLAALGWVGWLLRYARAELTARA